jgi:hypothetical protein
VSVHLVILHNFWGKSFLQRNDFLLNLCTLSVFEFMWCMDSHRIMQILLNHFLKLFYVDSRPFTQRQLNNDALFDSFSCRFLLKLSLFHLPEKEYIFHAGRVDSLPCSPWVLLRMNKQNIMKSIYSKRLQVQLQFCYPCSGLK